MVRKNKKIENLSRAFIAEFCKDYEILVPGT